MSSQDDLEVPSAGESGWDGDLPPPPPGSPPDTCTVNDINVYPNPYNTLDTSAGLIGPCSTATLTATVSGPPVTIASDLEQLSSGAASSIFAQIDVCELPGGSDFPGTVVQFEVTGSASATDSHTLPDFGDSLQTAIERSSPGAGSRVQPGDRIELLALAMVLHPALGVEVLYLDDGNDLIDSVGNNSGSDEPTQCDLYRYFAELDAEYEVPANPPPIIEICANAAGFDGTKARDCVEFYTGEVWEGTVGGTFEQPDCTASSSSGTIQMNVADDGIATGSGTTITSAYTCDNGASIPETSFSYEFSGTATNGTFTLDFPDGFQVTLLPTAEDQVEGTVVDDAGGGYVSTVTLTLDCLSCEDAVA